MARSARATVVDDVLDDQRRDVNTDDFCDDMSDDGVHDSGSGPQDADLPPYAAVVQQGYRTYIRDLPVLLRAKREGYMVAYRGNKQLDISRSDRTLHRLLTKRPDYESIKDELFVTRVTVLDADELGISFKR
jgi:hypothetical protein